jgi:hypothetical protein
MGIFGTRLGSATTSNAPPYFPTGLHFEAVSIETVKWQEKQGKKGVYLWIVNGRVESCAAKPELVGQTFGWVQKVDTNDDQQRAMADGSIKGFMFAVLGKDPGDDAGLRALLGVPETTTVEAWGTILDGLSEQFVAKANPMRGKRVSLTTADKAKKNSPGVITIHDWKPVRIASATAAAVAS